MRKYIFYIFLFLLINGCNTSVDIKAQKKSQKLLDCIAEGKADKYFSIVYFPDRQKLDSLLLLLKENCSLLKRTGNFINNFQQKINGKDFITSIYEFHLACNDIRFLFTFEIKADSLETAGFAMQTIQENNPMITHPERRLWKGNKRSE